MSTNFPTNLPPMGPPPAMPGGSGGPSGPFKPINPVAVLRRSIWLLILLFLVGLILGGGLWYTLREHAPSYTSEALLQVRPSTGAQPFSAIHDELAVGPRMDQLEAYIQNEIMRVRSEQIIMEALRDDEVQNTNWFAKHGPLTAATERLIERDLNVGNPRGTTLIRVRVSTPNGEESRAILRAVTEQYLRRVANETEQQYRDRTHSFRETQDRWERRERELQNQIQHYVQTHDLDSLTAQHSASMDMHRQLSRRVVELQQMYAQMQQTYQIQVQRIEQMRTAREQMDLMDLDLQELRRAQPEAMQQVSMMAGIQNIDERLRTLRQHRRTLLANFGPEHYEVRRVNEQIEAAEIEKREETIRLLIEHQEAQTQRTAGTVSTYQAMLAELQPQLVQASRRMVDLNQRLAGYQQLIDQREYAQGMREQAENALNEAQVHYGSDAADPVRQYLRPSQAELTFPRPLIIIPGMTLLVVGLGMGLVFLREMLDQRVHSPVDMKLVPDAELLGMLPDSHEDPTGQGRIERVVETDPTGLMAESFRQLRTELMLKMDRRGYKSLVFASAQPEAGTSAVLHNLAASLVLSGKRVLVIDANFRRPEQHLLLNASNERGLIDYLQGHARLDELVQPVNGGEGLAVLATGPAEYAPPELLDHDRFRTLLNEAEREYDLILIDAPPALLTSDAQLLAKHVDAAALIIRADADKRGMIQRLVRQLDGQRADLLGVILNGVQSSAGGYFRRNYREFYRYRRNGNGQTRPTAGRLASQPSVPAGSGSGNGRPD